MRRVVQLGIAALYVALLGAAALPPTAKAVGSPQTDPYTNRTQFQTGTLQGVTTTGSGDGASLTLCEGGPDCEQYRRPVYIDNSGGPELHSVEVLITLDTASLITAGKLQADCGDLRVATDDGTSLPNGRIIDCDSATSTIDLLVPTIAADDTTTLYLYYHSLNTLLPLNGSVRENIDASMTANPVPPATLEGDATWSSANGYVELTNNSGDQIGALQYNDNPGNNFDFSTDFWTGGGDGADSIYLYMGANGMPSTENDDVGGYIFSYDEYQDYIGLQYQGHGLYAIYCNSHPMEISFDTEVHSSAACNLDDSTWHTARVLRTGDEIKMYLDGNLVIDYTPEDPLPDTEGPYMGWGARTGGSTNYHRIRNVSLDINSTPLDATHATVGAEEGNPEGMNDTGTWTSPAIQLASNENNQGAWGDGNSASTALAGNYSGLSSGDTVTVSVKGASTVAGLATASLQTLQTYNSEDDGSISFTVDELDGYVSASNNAYAQLVVTLSRAGETSPLLDDLSVSYTTDFYGPPSAPQNLAVDSVSGRTATVTWDPPAQNGNSEIIEYYIEYKFADDSWDTIIDSAYIGAVENPSADLLLPRLGADYSIRIYATNDYGNGAYATLDYTTAAPAVHHITDCEALQAINDHPEWWADTFYLDNDIDCTATPDWNEGAGFSPIGSSDYSQLFSGIFDGQNHTILGLTINWPGTSYVGLFVWTEYGTIRNLNFSGGAITGQEYVGAAVGDAGEDTTLTNIHTDIGDGLSVSGDYGVGGVAGWLESDTHVVTISNLSAGGTVAGADGSCEVGGLVGYVGTGSGATLSNLHASSTVSGSCYVGGLIGELGGSFTLTDSSATGDVTAADNYVGGLIGYVDDYSGGPAIRNSYATGNVISAYDGEVGGLIGAVDNDGDAATEVSKVYATGNVSATRDDEGGYDYGGLIGYTDSNVTVINAYATGNVTVPDNGDYYNAGGLIGNQEVGASVTNTYATGAVSGSDDIGGLLGDGGGSVTNSFAAGRVTPVNGETTYVGGLVGYGWVCTVDQDCDPPEGTSITNSYYDQTATGQSACAAVYGYSAEADDTVLLPQDGCTAITTANYFVNKTTGPLFSTWNFSTVWYPHAATPPTFTSGEADDNDGIPSVTEDAGPNSGDANGDGFADSQQDGVAAFVNPVTGHYAAVALPDGCSLSGVSAQSEASLASDSGFVYPLGLLNFSATCGAGSGFTTTVTQYFYNPPAGTFTLRKFIDGAYQTVSGATIARQTIGGQAVLTVSYSVTDGGPLDADGTANGVIIDPAGPAEAAVDAPNTGLMPAGLRPYLVVSLAGVLLLAAAAAMLRYNRR